VLAVESEEPPWAGTLVCERAETDDVPEPTDADDVPSPSARPFRLKDDLPLHLRVLRALTEGHATQERMDQALALANEVYELEAKSSARE
jgi:hypothetical protein